MSGDDGENSASSAVSELETEPPMSKEVWTKYLGKEYKLWRTEAERGSTQGEWCPEPQRPHIKF